MPSFIDKLTGGFMAVDLGTANTLIYTKEKGIIMNEPSIVAVDENDTLVAAGNAAKRMLGRTPENIRSVRPLENGVISDFEICEKMLGYFLAKVHKNRIARPRVVICVPSGVTPVEKRAVQEVAEITGAKKPVYIIEEPIAAAIGAGLPIGHARGSLIADIGGGTTEVAVISLGGIVVNESVRGTGGDKIDSSIMSHIEKFHNLLIGEATAERIKIRLASAWPLQQELMATIPGRDIETGFPREIELSTNEIREAISEQVMDIVDAVRSVLDNGKTPPQLAADIIERGATLAGGGALLTGLKERIEHETKLKVNIAPNPKEVVVIGSGKSLEDFKSYGSLLYSSQSLDS